MLTHTGTKKRTNQRIQDNRRVEADKTAYANKRAIRERLTEMKTI